VPRLRDADLEEVRIVQHRAGRGIAAARMPPDAGAIEIDPRIFRSQVFHAGDLIGQRVVANVAEVRVVELLRAPGRAHAVDFDDDEPEIGERLRIAARGEEIAWTDASGLRTWIDVIDD